MAPLVYRSCRVHHVRIRYVGNLAPLLKSTRKKAIDILNFRSTIEHVMQTLKPATLNAHLLRMWQGNVVSQDTQGKGEATS